jgi:hypothetical protein
MRTDEELSEWLLSEDGRNNRLPAPQGESQPPALRSVEEIQAQIPKAAELTKELAELLSYSQPPEGMMQVAIFQVAAALAKAAAPAPLTVELKEFREYYDAHQAVENGIADFDLHHDAVTRLEKAAAAIRARIEAKEKMSNG